MKRKRVAFFPILLLSLGAFAAGVMAGWLGGRNTGALRAIDRAKLDQAFAAVERLDAGHALSAILPALSDSGPDPRIGALLRRASQRLQSQDARIAALTKRLQSGYAHRRIVEIERAQVAYPLLPPKLMISVQALTGGSLITHFSDRTQIVAVGRRVDIVVDGLTCFLILLESRRRSARFDFGCEEPVRKAARAPL